MFPATRLVRTAANLSPRLLSWPATRTLLTRGHTHNHIHIRPRARTLATAAAAVAATTEPTPSTFTTMAGDSVAVDNGGPRVPYAQLAGRLNPKLLRALEVHGFVHMTPVQEKVLHLPTFTQDCLVQAKTGTGKTLAFLLPALQNLLSVPDLDRSTVGILVLAPTRELAQQIADECDKLTSACTPPLECHIAVGGSNRKAHLGKFLKGKPTILVATPGRLIDYLSEDAARQKLTNLRCVVLDEADRMLDAGFAPDLRRILSNIPAKAQAGWQGMCFSATVPPEIQKMLPMVLDKDHARISTIDPNEAPTVALVPQSVFPVASVDDILPTLHSVLACARADNPALKAVIFCPTARHAALLYHIFGHTGGAAPPKLPVFQMQSRMSQPSRTRTVEQFKATDRGLLFASDVVGRGMDFPDINLVVQIGVPSEKDQYVHRVGRTGRAGKVGEAVMILAPEEMWFVSTNKDFPIKNNGPFNHPKASLYPSATIIQAALDKIPIETKEQAYVGNLGFIKSLMKRYRLDAPGVVALANRFATSFGCPEVPTLRAMTVGKMGLKGVPGLVVEGRGTIAGPPPGAAAGSVGVGREGGGGRGRGGDFGGNARAPGGFGENASGRGDFGGNAGGRGGGFGSNAGGRGGFGSNGDRGGDLSENAGRGGGFGGNRGRGGGFGGNRGRGGGGFGGRGRGGGGGFGNGRRGMSTNAGAGRGGAEAGIKGEEPSRKRARR